MKKSSSFRNWEQLYQEQEVESMPWFHLRLDHDLEDALKTLGIKSATALDLGTGPGTQAIALAKKGFQVTATDVSKTAVDKATSRSLQDGRAPIVLVLNRSGNCFSLHSRFTPSRNRSSWEPGGHCPGLYFAFFGRVESAGIAPGSIFSFLVKLGLVD